MAVHAHGHRPPGVEQLAQLLLGRAGEDEYARDLDAAARAARRGADEHQQHQHPL